MKSLANMVILSADDNVGVALKSISAGEAAVDGEGHQVMSGESIPQGHKISLVTIAEGDRIVRFGVPVGIARSAIRPGSLVHVHNVRSQYLDNDEDHYE